MTGISIKGLGKSVPSKVLTNEELSSFVDTSDEWIKTRTGISSRHVATTETTTELAVNAAKEALEKSKVDKNDVKLIIVATVTPDSTMPSTACKVANALGIEDAMCFDITAACSGFVYATEIAINLMKGTNIQNSIVVGAEVLSKQLEWEDRSTSVLFGDGAGAIVYSRSDKNSILSTLTGSKSSGVDQIVLQMPEGNRKFYKNQDYAKGIYMNGKGVYSFATTVVPKTIVDVLDTVKLTPEDIDWYVLHQANSRIMDRVAKSLEVSCDKFFKNLDTHGNTSAASIPMALYDLQDSLRYGDKIIASGFGAGLTFGTMLIEWNTNKEVG